MGETHQKVADLQRSSAEQRSQYSARCAELGLPEGVMAHQLEEEILKLGTDKLPEVLNKIGSDARASGLANAVLYYCEFVQFMANVAAECRGTQPKVETACRLPNLKFLAEFGNGSHRKLVETRDGLQVDVVDDQPAIKVLSDVLSNQASGINLGGDEGCLLYTSDAADEEDSVDLGGRRIIKKKKRNERES
eukprot:TRINITY_DN5969_c0_g1_i2.p1 TRINITY_DN5969_c0_g1~~TRINITY_DN5969_c0_g1_i2.p1  ORF type:complete len:192 (-),score=53.37 TRINITY_DN5969_c0_g1_i2:39-614(-)